jgi:hypothetical protein
MKKCLGDLVRTTDHCGQFMGGGLVLTRRAGVTTPPLLHRHATPLAA